MAPENTCASFERAAALGVDGVELDVHLCEDTLVVIHDATLERTTNGTGPVAQQSLARLRRLDAGGGERVPTLMEVLEVLPAGMLVNIELKGDRTETAVAKVLPTLADRPVVVSSFDHSKLTRLRQTDEHVALAPLMQQFRLSLFATAQALDAVSINLGWRAATRSRVERAGERGWPVWCYTVNTVGDATALKAMGVSAVFTDRPDLLITEHTE